MTATEIKTAVRTAREAKGWTYLDLAEASGVNRNTIAQVELGYLPKMSTLTAITEALGLSWKLTPSKGRPVPPSVP